jgi:hypothetical protein
MQRTRADRDRDLDAAAHARARAETAHAGRPLGVVGLSDAIVADALSDRSVACNVRRRLRLLSGSGYDV